MKRRRELSTSTYSSVTGSSEIKHEFQSSKEKEGKSIATLLKLAFANIVSIEIKRCFDFSIFGLAAWYKLQEVGIDELRQINYIHALSQDAVVLPFWKTVLSIMSPDFCFKNLYDKSTKSGMEGATFR